jgi:cation transport ATPase
MADRLGAWYTPLAVAIAAIGWAISDDPARFLAAMVIATPCPLLIAIPVAKYRRCLARRAARHRYSRPRDTRADRHLPDADF